MALRISLFYAAIFSVIGVMMPFWPVWLKAQGMTPIQIGLILAAGTWTRAIVNPLLAQTADRQGRPDILIIGLGWGALGLHTLLLFTNGFWLLFVVCVIASTLLFALMPMADAVTMLKVRKGLIDYGRVRLWGSLTFIVTAIGGGYLLKDKTEDLILWLVIGLLIITVGSCHIVPRSDTSGTKRFLEPLTYIFRNRSLLFFILAASLIQASHAVYYGFSTLHWRAQGINEA
ncbi:MAG: MFS transporter, partial [Pseudomonadota bacterium]|nr:MFS transporter [Pseudomonadota bacterium]